MCPTVSTACRGSSVSSHCSYCPSIWLFSEVMMWVPCPAFFLSKTFGNCWCELKMYFVSFFYFFVYCTTVKGSKTVTKIYNVTKICTELVYSFLPMAVLTLWRMGLGQNFQRPFISFLHSLLRVIWDTFINCFHPLLVKQKIVYSRKGQGRNRARELQPSCSSKLQTEY